MINNKHLDEYSKPLLPDSAFFRPGCMLKPAVASVRMYKRIDRLSGQDAMSNLTDKEVALAIAKESVLVKGRGEFTYWLVLAQGTIGWVNAEYMQMIMYLPEDLLKEVKNDLSSWRQTRDS